MKRDQQREDVTDRVMAVRNILVDPFNTLRRDFPTPYIVGALALLIAETICKSSEPVEARNSFVDILDKAIEMEHLRKRIGVNQ